MQGPTDPQQFVQLLRESGMEVGVGSAIRFTEALGILGAPGMPELYWAARSTLLVRREQLEAFDEAFAAFFLGQGNGEPESVDTPEASFERAPEAALLDNEADVGTGTTEERHVAWSRAEQLAHRDLADCSGEELAELHAAIRTLRMNPPEVASRRRRLSRRGQIDLRRTIRSSMRSGTELAQPRHRDRSTTRRRMVLLVDVSGSMEPYARTLLRFAHAAVQSSRRVEVFGFATRLTRLTHQLRASEADTALQQATRDTADMSGGTRLGDVLSEFNRKWGLRGTARGAVVVILSDGWDRGDRGLVDAEMQRLARVAERIVWVNPLKASEGYEPIARGMAEALGHVDAFVEGHSLSSLRDLAKLVADSTGADHRAATLARR